MDILSEIVVDDHSILQYIYIVKRHHGHNIKTYNS